MKRSSFLLFATALASAPSPSLARSAIDTSGDNGGGESVLQCVPYARDVTGIRIYGDAHTWWAQAEGRYRRGSRPEVGAVMAVRPYGNSRLGHVAAVSWIVDSRTVLLKHANWSEPGMIENNVRAVDVSPDNDWSEVRIWYAPTRSLGAGHWPLYGFIYNEKPGARDSAGRNERKTSKSPKGDDLIADIIAGRVR